MMRRLLLLVGLFVALGVPGLKIWHQEHLAASGQRMRLQLAPRDPRSLAQGDYMLLRYGLARELLGEAEGWPLSGQLVVTLDGDLIVVDARLHQGESLAASEHLLRYRLRDGHLHIGAESFFFQEGNASLYDAARYGELRVAADGEAMLVGLLDDELDILGPLRGPSASSAKTTDGRPTEAELPERPGQP